MRFSLFHNLYLLIFALPPRGVSFALIIEDGTGQTNIKKTGFWVIFRIAWQNGGQKNPRTGKIVSDSGMKL